MCRPKFIEQASDYEHDSILNLKQMKHPCVVLSGSKKNFVPNDTLIDTLNNQGVLLVTGPNMGGKSTLLR